MNVTKSYLLGMLTHRVRRQGWFRVSSWSLLGICLYKRSDEL